MGETINAYRKLIGKPEVKRQIWSLSGNGKVILKLILKKMGLRMWTGLNWLRIGSSGGLL
jgi:hypothetical protein